MRIVERGTLPEEQLWQGTCTHCRTRIEFERHEGKFHDDQRDGSYVTIACPVCQMTIYGNRKR